MHRLHAWSTRLLLGGAAALLVMLATPATATSVAVGAAGPPDVVRDAFVRPPDRSGIRQIVVVSAPHGSSRATLQAYEKRGAIWVKPLPPMPARLGPKGFTNDPHELDWYTPAGDFAVLSAFGSQPSPGTKLVYTRVGPGDHWVDDVTSPFYNTWQTGDPAGRWRSAENLNGYAYAITFDFNMHPVVPNRNSAIFLHAAGDYASGGCVTVSLSNLLTLLHWFDPAAEPHLQMGFSD